MTPEQAKAAYDQTGSMSKAAAIRWSLRLVSLGFTQTGIDTASRPPRVLMQKVL